jgi:RimJ/RimL family protein N-acetyltransferase
MEVKDSMRLSFALMDENDAELLFKLDQDPNVMRYINGGHMTTMEEVNEVFIPRMQSYTSPDKGWGLWKVLVKETNAFIGWILVRPMDFFNDKPAWDDLELGWRFMKSAWGKGYGTEAAQQVVEALIELGGISKLSALAMEENSGSINIMKKLGMEYIKTDVCKDPLGDLQVVYYSMPVIKAK